MKKKIEAIILEIVSEIGKNDNNQNLANPTVETSLFGLHGNLDSLGLVNLIADLEDRLRDTLNRDIVLADERAMSLRHSPFRTVQSLIDYVNELLEKDE